MTKHIKGFGGGKGGGGGGHTPTEDPDSLLSRQYARVLDLLSEGEIEGLVDGLRSIYLDGTPVQNVDGTYNFSGVSYHIRNGTQAQDLIPGFPLAEAEQNVSTQVVFATPIVRTLTNANLNAARVTVSVPQLTLQDPSTGDLGGTSVELAIDLQSNGGGYVAQPVGRVWVSVPTTGTTYTRNSVYGIGATVTSDTPLENADTLSFNVEYRLVGAPSWITLSSVTWSNSDNVSQSRKIYTGAGDYDELAQPPVRDYFTIPLSLGNYELRVVKTAGVGNPSLTAGYYMTSSFTDVIKGKTTSRYQRSYRIDLVGSPPWDIRVRRITADSSQANLQNQTFWDTYTEIIDTKLSYPNSAICAVQVDAAQFRRVPTRGYEIKGVRIKVPTNYDPIARTYAGVWDGTFKVAWSNNPAWCFYDLVTNTRYGLGQFNVTLDKWKLYTIAQYCDALVPNGVGGQEPRFTCNLFLQTREEAFTVVVNLASIFRAMPWWGAGTLTVSQDSPIDPIMQFSLANVVDGEFTYSSTSGKVRHTVVLVAWNDPVNDYRQVIEYVEDTIGIARYGVVQTDIVAFGCTSRGQAHRLGKWLLFSERLETELVTFQVAMDGMFVYPGAVIQTTDPFRAGVRFGGRVVTATTSQVNIDSPVTIEALKTYTLYCQLPNGTIESRTVTNTPGSTSSLTLSTTLTTAPQGQSIWVLAASDLLPETWRVISVMEVEKTKLEITALEYNSSKFAAVEQNIKFDARPVSALTSTPVPPTNLVVTESLYEAAVGIIGIKAHLSWVSSQPSFIVSYRKQNGNWIDITVRQTTADILGLEEDFYDFSVKAVNAVGVPSRPTSVTQQILGKQVPPADPANLIAAQNGDFAVFRVPRNDELDFLHFEFRYGPQGFTDWNSMTPITDNFGKKVTLGSGDTSLTTGDLPPGNHTVAVKAVDTSLNYSQNAAYDDLNFTSTRDVIDSAVQEPDWIGNFVPSFNGTTSYGEVADNAAFNFERTNSFSVRLHVKIPPVSSAAVLFEKFTNDANLRGYGISLSASGQVIIVLRNGAGNLIQVTTTTEVDDNIYHTILFTYAGTSLASGLLVYIDEVLASRTVNNDTLTGTIQGVAALRFGRRLDGSLPTNMRLAECLIYNRVLTAAEVLSEYMGNDAIPITDTVSKWIFSIGTGTTIYDADSVNDVTLSSITWEKDLQAYRVVSTVANTIIPDSYKLASELTNAELFEQFVPYPYEGCMYYARQIDIGFDNNVRIWASIESNLGPGILTGLANPKTYIDFREAVNRFDGFEEWSIGNRVLRYLRAAFKIEPLIGKIVVTSFVPTADLEERIERGTNATFANTGTPVVFSTQFHRLPHVQITPVGSTDLTAAADAVTTVGFTGYRFPSTGLVNWEARGV